MQSSIVHSEDFHIINVVHCYRNSNSRKKGIIRLQVDVKFQSRIAFLIISSTDIIELSV